MSAETQLRFCEPQVFDTWSQDSLSWLLRTRKVHFFLHCCKNRNYQAHMYWDYSIIPGLMKWSSPPDQCENYSWRLTRGRRISARSHLLFGNSIKSWTHLPAGPRDLLWWACQWNMNARHGLGDFFLSPWLWLWWGKKLQQISYWFQWYGNFCCLQSTVPELTHRKKMSSVLSQDSLIPGLPAWKFSSKMPKKSFFCPDQTIMLWDSGVSVTAFSNPHFGEKEITWRNLFELCRKHFNKLMRHVEERGFSRLIRIWPFFRWFIQIM